MSTREPLDEQSAAPRPKKVNKNDLTIRKQATTFLPFIALVLLIIIFGIGNSAFLSVPNFFNILRQSAVLLVAALGGTFIILMGSIDLSIGSLITISGCVAAILLGMNAGVFAAIVCTIGTGLIAGLINGLIFTYGKIPSFLVTLGMLSVLDGLSLIVLGGRPLSITNETFKWLSSGTLIGALPNVALWSLIIYGICIFIAFRTRFGRYMFAIGGGERVAKLSGVPVERYKVYAFILSGILAGIAGLLMAARIGAATPRMGEGILLDSIAAVVMGGTSLTGGVGGPHRTILGVFVISILSNGLNILSVDPYIQIVIKGAVVILAVLITIDRSRITVNK